MATPVSRQRVGEPTRLRSADVIGEALASIVAAPARALLTSLGVLLGVAWFVAVLGLVSTAAGQVTTTFASRLATQVTVRPRHPGPAPAAYPYPADVEPRLKALNGVVAAGVYWRVRLPGPVIVSATGPVTPRPGSGPAPPAGARPPVIAASPGFLAAAGIRVSQGRPFGPWAQARAQPVCLLGAALARVLGIRGVRGQPSVSIDNEPCAVIGIFSHAVRQPSLLRAVVLPSAAAVALWGPPGSLAGAQPTVLIQTRPGAAAVVGEQAPYAISPTSPHQFAVIVPMRPQRLRDQVARTLASLFIVLGWVSLAIGILVIAAVTWLSVTGRLPEYALRRSVGARRRHIVLHVLAESAILGFLGGLAGASLGLAVVLLVSQARHVEAVVAPLTVLPAPLAGTAAGVLAGLIPALRAARVQPATALRG